MKKIFIVILLCLFVCTPSIAGDLKKLSLDDIATLGLKIENDSSVKVEGDGSIKISTLWPITICLGEVTGLNIENAKLIYKASVKSQLDGAALLEMWVHVDGGQYFSRGLNSTVTGNSDWKSIQAPFMLQKGQNPDRITLNLIINGKGTVWIDNIVLSKESLK
ncbi:MAG: hypothetical protein PVG87_25595 [Desulfobacteraceae bacterium]